MAVSLQKFYSNEYCFDCASEASIYDCNDSVPWATSAPLFPTTLNKDDWSPARFDYNPFTIFFYPD